MSKLFLSFYADGPLADNVTRIPAYPSGMSYFRPFRYRDEWIQPSLLAEVADPESRARLLNQEAVLAMRFIDDASKSTIIPVRRVIIRHIHHVPDLHSIYFSLDRFYDFREIDELDDLAVTPSQDPEQLERLLFFRGDVEVPRITGGDVDEDGSWIRFTKLVSTARLPISQTAKNSLFLRLQQPVTGGERIAPELLHTSFQAGPLYGFSFSEGRSYEFTYLHRFPSLIGRNTGAGAFSMKYAVDTQNLELSSSEEGITANYQPHYFETTARKPTGTSEILRLKPDREMVKAKDGTDVQLPDCPVPVKVRWNWRYRARTNWVWLVLLVAAFIATNAVSYWYEATVDPEKSVSGGVLVARIAGAGLLGFLIWALQQRTPKQ